VYELFVYSHITAAITYIGLMFWHAGNEGDSVGTYLLLSLGVDGLISSKWAYLWATLAIWLFSNLGRIFYRNSAFSIRRSWLDGFPSTVHDLSGDMVKLQVFVPSTYMWRPSQHCFLRIPTLSIFDSHPFTIASAPDTNNSDNAEEKRITVNTLVFLVRPHEGFTRKLSAYARDNTDISLRVFVDGPYGGLSRKIENDYDSVVLVAGGGGITASVSWLLYLAARMRAADVAVKQVMLVWVVRKEMHLRWAREELATAQATAPQGGITFEFHITDEINHSTVEDPDIGGRVQDTTPKVSLDLNSTVEEQQSVSHMGIRRGLPSLGKRIMQTLHAPRTCVLGCGPESMKIDLSNAVARAQRRVWKGEFCEVALHTETFGW
jgi:predicted ferric reductase